MAMHTDELHVDAATARRLIAEQFPQWNHLRVRPLTTDGTVNAIYRIGDELTAGFPLHTADPAAINAELIREAQAMKELHDSCPFPTPTPIAVGHSGHGYPLSWSIQTWVPGDVASPTAVAHSTAFVLDLVTLIRALRATDTRGRAFTGTGRGGHLPASDAWMETCLTNSAGFLPVDRLRALWGWLRALPPAGPDVMTHGDLTPGNLLIDEERLVGVLDGGGFGPADPALDLVAAWHMLDADARTLLRSELDSGDVEWHRGAAWAFEQAMGAAWYYRESNPGMSALGRTTLARILDDTSIAAAAGD
jgi:aminoglycoside phosphotransferase (APT) family kinase protein